MAQQRNQGPRNPDLECIFCKRPAVTIAYGFSLCRDANSSDEVCLGKARAAGDLTLSPKQRDLLLYEVNRTRRET